jgi:hypothetical protein
MPINRGGFAPLLAVDLRQVYIETGKERPLEYPLLFNVDNMEWNPVKDQQIAGLGTMPTKPEGEQFKLDEPVLGGTKEYLADPFGLATEVTWEMWRDEMYGIMRELVAEMQRASRNRQEVDAWSVVNNGFDNAFPGFDGVSLFNTAHPGIREGAQANRPSPDVGFSITGIQNSITRFEGMVNSRGMPRLMTPVMAVITATNKYAAREILGSSGKPFTADNEINALVQEDLSWMIAHYITTPTNWFLAAAKGIHDLNFLWRDMPIFDAFDDPWTKNAVFTSYQRHTKGFGSYRGVDGSTG